MLVFGAGHLGVLNSPHQKTSQALHLHFLLNYMSWRKVITALRSFLVRVI